MSETRKAISRVLKNWDLDEVLGNDFDDLVDEIDDQLWEYFKEYD